MRRVRTHRAYGTVAAVISLMLMTTASMPGQSRQETNTLASTGMPARPVIIPLTIRLKGVDRIERVGIANDRSNRD